jgi:ABC-type glycerol-3-phosphate transport system permease component
MIAIAAVGVFLALPMVYLVSASLMSEGHLRSYPPKLLPDGLNFGNYVGALQFLTAPTILNSVIFTVAVVILQWMLTIMGGLVLAKFRVRGMVVLTALFAACLLLPAVAIVIPTFVVANALGMTNSYVGLIVPIVAQIHFGVLLFRQSIQGIPHELFEAARECGAGWWRILISIVVPLSAPSTGAYVAITALTAWNMYLWPLVAVTDPAYKVLPLALAPLASGQYSQVPQTVQLAATLLTTLPMLLAFLVAQRSFVRGLVGSGVE